MPIQTAATLAVALLFAAVHVGGRRFDFLAGTPRSVWLSIAGGVSVAYVFVHLLPELASHQREVLAEIGPDSAAAVIGTHVYVVALLGLAFFYGLDTMLRRSRREAPRPPATMFWIHLAAFALYNILIGYLLVHREEPDMKGLAIYAVALGLHFIINDRALREHHGELYAARGRWLLGAAPLAGWLLGVLTEIGQLWLSALFALLAGSIILNVLKEELPPDRESRFSAFALGTAGYALLLLLIG